MSKHLGTLLGAILACTSLTAHAVWEMSNEEYVGFMHGSAAGCEALIPDAVKLGLAEWNEKLKGYDIDLAKIADSPVYKKTYADELARLKALPEDERMRACKWTFNEFLPADAPAPAQRR